MSPFDNLSEIAKRKVQLYTAAFYLFEVGKSHPQIIELLSEYEPDKELLELMVDKAMTEDWDKLFSATRQMLSEGRTYEDVIAKISKSESDLEIVRWICDSWYKWKEYYAECVIESPTNITEGSQWVIISAIVIVLLFMANTSLIPKILWGVVCLGAIIQWLLGIQQRKFSRQIEKIFQGEQ